MNILIIVDSLALGGGAEKFAASLGNELAKRDHQIYYLTTFDDNPKYDFKGEYFSFNEKRSRNIIYKAVNFFLKPHEIRKICKDNKIDVVISVGEEANFRAILSKYFYKNKSRIFSTHHLDPEVHLNNRINYNKIKFLYSKSDKVICVSKAIESTLNNKYGLKNVLTIYNLMDINLNLNKGDVKLAEKYKPIFDENLVFINIGRLDFQKGQWFLIRSFKKVQKKVDKVKLCILGDGDLKDDLYKLVDELGLENDVLFLGNHDNIFPFLKNSDCFVLSSLLEGFPLTLIEALSMDLPIISTDCKTGPRECLCPELDINEEIKYPYFGEYGVLTKPFNKELNLNSLEEKELDINEEILYKIMLKIIERPDLKNRYSNGLKRAEQFDKNKIIDQWERLFKE